VDAGRIDPQRGGKVMRSTWFTSLVVLAIGCIAAPTYAQAPASFGVYLGAGCDGVKRLEPFERWLGRDVGQVIDFASWKVFEQGTMWGVSCWQKAGQKNVVFSVPMLPDDKSATLADGAAGKFDPLFRRYAENLIKRGYSNAVVRIGWEFNADWYPWAAKRDPQSWVAYWRRAVTAMREVPGANFKFDWCAAGGWSAFRAETVYPGDDYVDIIGLDFYNSLGFDKGDVTPQRRWELRMKAPHGLEWHRNFAKAHDKPISFPEWGTGVTKQARGGDDDPYFIEQMAAWIAANRVAYHNYWDFTAPILDSKLSNGRRPAAGAALIRAFGNPSKSSQTAPGTIKEGA
jgi:hypothetical protein